MRKRGLYTKTMKGLEKYYQDNKKKLLEQRRNYGSIRSSQIAAVIGYLIERDIIK